MKIISFNIRCADDPDGHSIDERAPRLKTVLEKYNADIVGFQEATPKWMDYLTDYFSAEYEIFNKYRAKSSAESTPIMWRKKRFDCIDKGYFWLSDTPDTESKGWDTIGCYRICLWAKLKDKATNKEFLYLNTHYGFGDYCQTASDRLIIDFVKQQNIKSVVLTGDFNMKPDTAGYAVLSDYFVDVNMRTAADLQDTYHGYLNDTGEHIDYCFVTPAVKPLSSRRMTESFDGKFPSDHYGIYSEIKI